MARPMPVACSGCAYYKADADDRCQVGAMIDSYFCMWNSSLNDLLPLPQPCPVCGGAGQCDWTHKRMGDEMGLSAHDWELIYEFLRKVELPFLHALIFRAQQRAANKENYG